MKRRDFVKFMGSTVVLSSLPNLNYGSPKPNTSRPNILWITSEDNGPFLGCYGDKLATTPNLDKLASEGVLYKNAFSNAAVCAPCRSTIITGMYAPSIGTEHMRSFNSIPHSIKFLPQYLRREGYYCSNNDKEDYNMPKPDVCWNESSEMAHYKNRKPGQPFFSIFNIHTSHENSIHKRSKKIRHDPDKAVLPPYLPDTEEIRKDCAQYYDKVEEMDKEVGDFLKELDEQGLAEETIVFYYSDHGGVLPRSKRFIYDSGTHVPLIIRFPEKYKNLAPALAGSKLDRMVSYIDLAPTILSLLGITIPEYIQGQAFLGKQQKPEKEYVHLFRDRMDDRYDMMRAVRNKKFKYIRNYMPHRIYGQYLEYLWRAASINVWEAMYKEGKCNYEQSIFWETKPVEELYDITQDPYEVNNLAANDEYQNVLDEMRNLNKKWVREIRDTGFIPEGELIEMTREQTAYELIHEKSFPLDRIIETAEIASEKDSENLVKLIERMDDENSAVRYWSATGCAILGVEAERSIDKLQNLLHDPSADVRIATAEALCVMDQTAKAIPVLISEIKNENSKIALHALNVLDVVEEKAKSTLSFIKEALDTSEDKYIKRVARHILTKFESKNGYD